MPDGGLIAARALVYAALLLAAGLPLYLLSAGRATPLGPALRIALVLLAVIGAAASAWWALVSVAAMAALPLGDLDRATVTAVLAATPLRAVLEVRMAALLGLILASIAPLGRFRLPLAALCGSAALATCAFTGHAGASESAAGWLHRLADVVHLLAAATWLGALLMLLVSALGRLGPSGAQPSDLGQQLAAFARTGTLIVAALVLTGIVNSLAILGWPLPPEVWTSLWGKVLAAKLVLFAAMLGLAALNRWHLTPAFAANVTGSAKRLRQSLCAETGLALGVLALVAILGPLDPAG